MSRVKIKRVRSDAEKVAWGELDKYRQYDSDTAANRAKLRSTSAELEAMLHTEERTVAWHREHTSAATAATASLRAAEYTIGRASDLASTERQDGAVMLDATVEINKEEIWLRRHV